MKKEDIDKRIGMPDVDAEWARFEREVIGTSRPSFRHVATWVVGIGVAATILLLFVLNTDMEKATEGPIGVQQVAINSQQDDTPTNQQDDNVMRFGSTEPDTLPISHNKSKLALEDKQLEKRIAQLTIVPTSADLGSDYIMRPDGNPSDNAPALLVSDIKTKSDTLVTPNMQGHIAGLGNPQRSERQVSEVKIVGSDSVGTLKFLTNYSQGKELAKQLLIPVDSASESWQERHKRGAFYEKIRIRLMMPKYVDFGMGCEPSQSNEWSLYYDSVAHALIYTKAEKNIYWWTRDALFKEKRIGKNRYQKVLRKHPRSSKKLKVSSFSMPITNEQAQRLKAMWTDAISCSETKKAFALDGTKIEFPFGTLQAKTPKGVNPLVTFTNELAEAVHANDVVRKDSLLAESTLRKTLAETKDAAQPVQFDLNSLAIVVNKQQLPDSLCKLIRYRVRQYFHQQGMMIATKRDWSAYGAKYYSGYDKNCPLMELTTVPDTLNDTYVIRHPEMQQALRHVSGIVIDENERPLADVWVGIRGAGAGAPTDSTGHFSFWMPHEEKLLYAECLGYLIQRNIPADSSLTIRLRSATVIREVKVIRKDTLKHYHFLKQ